MRVLTLGTFDCLHRGHVRLLKRAAELGPVTVAVNRDRFIVQYKGRAPLMTYPERVAVLEACKYVHAVIPNADAADKQGDVIAKSKCDLIVIGTDWLHPKDYLHQLGIDKEFLAQHGIAIMFVPYTGGISTSDIRARCLASASPSSAPFTDGTKIPLGWSTASTAKAPVVPTNHGWWVKPVQTPSISEKQREALGRLLA